jgi:hypothetical protein
MTATTWPVAGAPVPFGVDEILNRQYLRDLGV